jgi:hypothetical protein
LFIADGEPELYKEQPLQQRFKLYASEAIHRIVVKAWWPQMPREWLVVNGWQLLRIIPVKDYLLLLRYA